MESRPGMIRQRIVRQISNNLLEIITEYIGLEMSMRTLVKINSNFKKLEEHMFQNYVNDLFDFKKLLFETIELM
jgi:hypothetical protein